MAIRTTKKTTTDPNANKVSVNTNKVKVNANKVDINAAKVRANAAKVAANTAKVKANAKATVVAPARNTKTTVVTPKAKALTPAQMESIPFKNNTVKNYEIYNRALLDRSGALYGGTGQFGTKAQQDSSIASISKYNIMPTGMKVTKSSFFPGNERLAKLAKTSRLEYVAPKDTKSGPLLKKPQTKESIESLQKRNR